MAEPRRHVRIVIADDHPLFRDGLRRLLESEPGFQVVGEASDCDAARRVVQETCPDVLLLDLAMPGTRGIDAVEAGGFDPTRVVLLTAALEQGELVRAVRHGVKGVVLKEAATRDLIDGIHRVMSGKLVLDAGMTDELARAVRVGGHARELPYGLTPRELEIVDLIAAGDGNRDIANRLNISPHTVKHHLSSIFDKTGTATRLELAVFALRHGIGSRG